MRNARSIRRMALTVGIGWIMVGAACGSAPTGLTQSDGIAYDVLAAPPLPVSAPVTTFDPATDIADLDGSVVVTVSGDQLLFMEHDGDIVASIRVDGAAERRAVSADGTHAALFERVDGASSRIIVVDRNGAEYAVVTYDLPGLVEPEAFSTDGRLLFVIDHQIAEVPGAYRIRPSTSRRVCSKPSSDRRKCHFRTT